MSDCACPSSQDKGSQQDQKKYEAAAEILDTGINQLQIAAMLLSLYWQKGGDSVYEMGKDAYELSWKLIALADAQSSSKLKICEEKEQVLGRLNHACLIVILRQQEDEAKKKQNAELARVVVERSKCCECLAEVDQIKSCPCNKAWYCSTDCQRKAWVEGHRKYCTAKKSNTRQGTKKEGKPLSLY